jgi:hypothetical protein
MTVGPGDGGNSNANAPALVNTSGPVLGPAEGLHWVTGGNWCNRSTLGAAEELPADLHCDATGMAEGPDRLGAAGPGRGNASGPARVIPADMH